MTIIYCKENSICIHHNFCAISTVRVKSPLCPCFNCLVKSMCKTICQERLDLFNTYTTNIDTFKQMYHHENDSNL